jgi:arginyl-tRNA synthetase
MIFETAAEAGWLKAPSRAEHIAFGSILGPDGKTLRSRAGTSVKLTDLLDEAVARAAAVVSEKNPELHSEEAAAVANAVGIGAVKYADLSTDRTKDYVFDYDRMLSFDGNTAPYLQYAYTRIQSIFRRGEVDPGQLHGPVAITDPTEHGLAVELLRFPDLLAEIEESLDFHRLCVYLYGVATAFSAFYEQCPILRADSGHRVSRLTLCNLTARTLDRGLDLLGISVLDRM